ncbi:MAG: extradiol ring-cleavage dioxygenase [Acidibacillus sp.]|nr:extradiol ring-cleavage dioxygenase [Acidibacillus sp.]
MNPFVFACITPHGSEIIEELAKPYPELMKKTRLSMESLGASMKESNPDTIIVLTPHGTRIDEQFAIVNCEHMFGEMEDYGAKISMDRKVDRMLAGAIADHAKQKGLPVATLGFATSEGPLSCMPLDWGVVVPLYFMPETSIVVITPSRSLSFEDHLLFGTAMAEAVAQSGKRVGLIASCDWSHAHDETGPYGFHEAARQLDEQVVTLLHTAHLEGMMQFEQEFIEHAKPDGIWQALMLAGAIAPNERKVEFLSYEVPTYFGLMCCAFH